MGENGISFGGRPLGSLASIRQQTNDVGNRVKQESDVRKADQEPMGLIKNQDGDMVEISSLTQVDSAVSEAHLQNTMASSKNTNFGSVDELTKYLRESFNVVNGGMTSISSKYLKKCLTDSDSCERLFDILRAADESYNSHKDEVGFQGMRIIVDENGEVTAESSKTTVSVNEGKRSRQIAAAATQKDMQAIIALLEQDLQEVENGYKQNMCDAAEVEKVKRLLADAKQRMGRLPDREPTQEEQSIMTINMLIQTVSINTRNDWLGTGNVFLKPYSANTTR